MFFFFFSFFPLEILHTKDFIPTITHSHAPLFVGKPESTRDERAPVRNAGKTSNHLDYVLQLVNDLPKPFTLFKSLTGESFTTWKERVSQP